MSAPIVMSSRPVRRRPRRRRRRALRGLRALPVPRLGAEEPAALAVRRARAARVRRGRRLRALVDAHRGASSIPAATPVLRCASAASRSSTAPSRRSSGGRLRAGRRARRRRRAATCVGRGGRARARPSRRAPLLPVDRQPPRCPLVLAGGDERLEVAADSDGPARRPGGAPARARSTGRSAWRRRGPTGRGRWSRVDRRGREYGTDWRRRAASRDAALARSLVAVHTLLAVDDGDVRLAARPARLRARRPSPAAPTTAPSRC